MPRRVPNVKGEALAYMKNQSPMGKMLRKKHGTESHGIEEARAVDGWRSWATRHEGEGCLREGTRRAEQTDWGVLSKEDSATTDPLAQGRSSYRERRVEENKQKHRKRLKNIGP